MKKLSIILGIICGLYNISQAQLNGLYVKTGTVMVSESFCFDSNRFLYSWKGDVGKVAVTSSGNYKIHKDTLTLNSDLQLKDLSQVKQHSLSQLDSLHISVITVSQVLPFKTDLIINDTTKIEMEFLQNLGLFFLGRFVKYFF